MRALLSLLGPYKMLFAATIAATVLASVLDGFTFVLLIPFLRTLFGGAALPRAPRNSRSATSSSCCSSRCCSRT